ERRVVEGQHLVVNPAGSPPGADRIEPGAREHGAVAVDRVRVVRYGRRVEQLVPGRHVEDVVTRVGGEQHRGPVARDVEVAEAVGRRGQRLDRRARRGRVRVVDVDLRSVLRGRVAGGDVATVVGDRDLEGVLVAHRPQRSGRAADVV